MKSQIQKFRKANERAPSHPHTYNIRRFCYTTYTYYKPSNVRRRVIGVKFDRFARKYVSVSLSVSTVPTIQPPQDQFRPITLIALCINIIAYANVRIFGLAAGPLVERCCTNVPMVLFACVLRCPPFGCNFCLR